MKTAMFALGLGLISIAPIAPAAPREPMDPVATASAFSGALASGDEAVVKDLLAPDVLIYESGGQESSRDEYTGHHMKEDIAFLAGTRQEVLGRQKGVSGDLAWVATRTRITGKYKNKPIDLFSTESMVLKREPAGWRIVHIQWSSQPAEKKTP